MPQKEAAPLTLCASHLTSVSARPAAGVRRPVAVAAAAAGAAHCGTRPGRMAGGWRPGAAGAAHTVVCRQQRPGWGQDVTLAAAVKVLAAPRPFFAPPVPSAPRARGSLLCAGCQAAARCCCTRSRHGGSGGRRRPVFVRGGSAHARVSMFGHDRVCVMPPLCWLAAGQPCCAAH